MITYAIRIVRPDGQALVVESRFLGDHAAIRRARTLAMDGDGLEVWRGMICVYQTAGAPTLH